MASLANIASTNVVKMLLLGDSGAGKTGSLASLAHAGYNVRIIDFDNGTQVLQNLLLDPKTTYAKDAYKRVSVVTLTEKVGLIAAAPPKVRQSTVWNRVPALLNNWKDKDEDFGSITTWTDKDVLVLDSLSFAGYAAMNFAGILNAGNNNMDGRAIYFQAQNSVKYLIESLYGDEIKCHVIITAHIQYLGDEMTITHGYPMSTVGRAFAPVIGRFFNSILMIRSEGTSRRIYTNPTSRVELKNSAPLAVKPYYDIRMGLAEFFEDVKIKPPASKLQVVS